MADAPLIINIEHDEVAEKVTAYINEKVHELEQRWADEVEQLRNLLADVVVKATEYGSQDGGFVAHYLLPTGPIHRAIPFLEQRGIVVRPGFDGRQNSG